MRRFLMTAAGWAAMAAFVPTGPALSASLQISPVTLTLGARDHATAVTLSNTGAEPIYGQVRVFHWDQKNGEDVLEPSTALLASPPMIQIEPGTEQMIRIVRPEDAPPAQEESYRILIDEIPQTEALDATGIMIRMRYSVPLFVSPAGRRGTPALQWQLQRTGSAWTLTARNNGAIHARVSKVSLVSGAGGGILTDGLMGYALAGKERRWNVPENMAIPASGAVRIRAHVNGEAQDQAVRVLRANAR